MNAFILPAYEFFQVLSRLWEWGNEMEELHRKVEFSSTCIHLFFFLIQCFFYLCFSALEKCFPETRNQVDFESINMRKSMWNVLAVPRRPNLRKFLTDAQSCFSQIHYIFRKSQEIRISVVRSEKICTARKLEIVFKCFYASGVLEDGCKDLQSNFF